MMSENNEKTEKMLPFPVDEQHLAAREAGQFAEAMSSLALAKVEEAVAALDLQPEQRSALLEAIRSFRSQTELAAVYRCLSVLRA